MADSEKWILITGASSGIGRATAEYCATEGFKVYAAARKESDLKDLQSLNNIHSLKIDVTQMDTIDAAISQISNRGTGLYAVINNAGIAKAGPLMDIPAKDLLEQFNVNLFGVHRITRECFPLLQESKGRIVMISSNSGFFAAPFFGPYCASKFALEGYSDALRRELLLTDIKVIIIQPGRINTPIWEKGEEMLDQFEGSQFETMARALGEYAIEKGKNDSLDPLKVAKTVYKSLISDKPKLRYLIVPDKFRNKILKILPSRIIDKKIEKELLEL